MTEALEFAKLNPGEVTVAGGVLLSGAHLITLIVEKYADVDLNYIPYDSGGQALVALLGENVDLFSASSGFILSSYQAGEVNVIAQSYDERQQLFSEVPTLAEVGMGLEQMSEPYTAWKALFIHSETPEEILKIYDEVIEKTVNDPEWIEFVENHNQIINFMPRGKFADHYLKQIDEFESLIKELR
jgi:putative tricarboxylic transport membrane protein